MATLSHSQLEALWATAGGLPGTEDTAAAISQAESGGRTDAILNTAYPNLPNYHPPAPGNLPEYSVGLWEINVYVHKQYTIAEMLTAVGNANAAVALSRGGIDFKPWSTFTTTDPKRTYKRFLTSGGTPGPQPGGTLPLTFAFIAPDGHGGYADLRNSVARHVPTQIRRSHDAGVRTWQILAGKSKVR